MKNKLFGFIVCVLLLGVVGCGRNTNNVNSDFNDSKIKGNCAAVECIKRINPENTVEEINQIIGFDGELIDEKYNIYYWEITKNTGVRVAYYTNNKGQISIDYDQKSLANSKVDFSKYSELKSQVSQGISYDDFISYLGGVEGVLVEKKTNTIQYTWVATDGSYINANFSTSTNKCTYITSRIL